MHRDAQTAATDLVFPVHFDLRLPLELTVPSRVVDSWALGDSNL